MSERIRLLGPSDAETWLALRLRALREEPRSFLMSEEEDAAGGVEAVAERLARPAAEAFVLGAYAGGALVGSVGVARAGLRKLRHRATLWGMYVAPEQRRLGLGRALMREAIERAGAMPGVEALALSVDAENEAAKALYRAHGFVTWGIEPDAFRAAGASIAEEHMLKALP
jgi:ribosomal protein S18 acetylase RimI-like enzyme